MNKTRCLLLTASLALALTLTLSCSGDDGNDGGNNNNGGGDEVTSPSLMVFATGRIDVEFGVLGSSNWGSKSNSTLPGFTQTQAGTGLENRTDPCGFSVTSGGATKSIQRIYLAGGDDSYFDINIILPGDPSNPAFTAGQSVTVSYTPNGTHIFKRTDGKTLGAFTLSATAR